MFTTIALLSLAFVPTPAVRGALSSDRPRIEAWTNRGEGAGYTRGERVRLFFRLDQDAYVTIFRVDTDGRVRVLFPRDPWEDNFARGGRDLEVDGRQLGSDAFTIDDYPGVGYLFAVASADAFVYDQIESGDHWDYRVIADGRVRGDPYVAMTDLAQRIVPEGYADWDYDVVSYNVGQHYDYPRFLCYDCHTYVSYSYWDPYYTSCVRFRMFVYDDPWYYPYRYYGGGRAVFVRPYRPQPRFIFKAWGSDRTSREGLISCVSDAIVPAMTETTGITETTATIAGTDGANVRITRSILSTQTIRVAVIALTTTGLRIGRWCCHGRINRGGIRDCAMRSNGESSRALSNRNATSRARLSRAMSRGTSHGTSRAASSPAANRGVSRASSPATNRAASRNHARSRGAIRRANPPSRATSLRSGGASPERSD